MVLSRSSQRCQVSVTNRQCKSRGVSTVLIAQRGRQSERGLSTSLQPSLVQLSACPVC